MGILYEVPGLQAWAIGIIVLIALMAFNEFGRTTRWGGLTLFLVIPVLLTIFVWPRTAAPGNEYGTGTWFNWVKTYSALAGCLGFMAIRFIPGLVKKKWALAFPAAILAINILEAVIRDFQCYNLNGFVDGVVITGGSWNI